jgi:hypothetical protein
VLYSLGMPQVAIDLDALEEAVENNTVTVSSYLHVVTGEVVRFVDGISDPKMHARIAADPTYLRVLTVRPASQYVWLEAFARSVADDELRAKLTQAIIGQGAFGRFKDVLASHLPERTRWFEFRRERVRVAMKTWLEAHGLKTFSATTNHVAWGHDPEPIVDPTDGQTSSQSRAQAHVSRQKLREIAGTLAFVEIDALVALAEFLLGGTPRGLKKRAADAENRSQPSGGDPPNDTDT